MNSETKERVILVVCGVVAAAVAIMLASSGNPGNMAICIACFVRDTAGAMKLQTNETVQYLRPEIIGIIVGACVMAFANKEFKATAGSSPFTRFVLGFVMMIGCLIFLGCPLRMVLRMAGGDLNAWVALIGFAAGIGVGVLFLKKGFSLGRAEAVKKAEGLALPRYRYRRVRLEHHHYRVCRFSVWPWQHACSGCSFHHRRYCFWRYRSAHAPLLRWRPA